MTTESKQCLNLQAFLRHTQNTVILPTKHAVTRCSQHERAQLTGMPHTKMKVTVSQPILPADSHCSQCTAGVFLLFQNQPPR